MKQRVNVVDPSTGKRKVGVLDLATNKVKLGLFKSYSISQLATLGDIHYFEKYDKGIIQR